LQITRPNVLHIPFYFSSVFFTNWDNFISWFKCELYSPPKFERLYKCLKISFILIMVHCLVCLDYRTVCVCMCTYSYFLLKVILRSTITSLLKSRCIVPTFCHLLTNIGSVSKEEVRWVLWFDFLSSPKLTLDAFPLSSMCCSKEAL
jgi:hypothetical protein